MEEEKSQAYGKRPMWQWVVIYLVIAAVLYGLFYYFVLAKKGTSYNQPQSNTYQNSPTSAPTSAVTEAKKVTISGNEFAFTPSKLSLKKGEAVEATFKNEGKYPHNLTIAGLNAQSKTIQPGESDTFTFTPDKTGSFSFSCTVDSHADKGMTGTLTVE